MGKVKDEQLFALLRDFLLVYLPNQRKASSNTVKAYRTTLNQFLKYISGQKNISVLSVTFEMVTYKMVNSYLDWLSEEKNAAPATRNNRLAAIRAFISYAAARNISVWQAGWPLSESKRMTVLQKWIICRKIQ